MAKTAAGDILVQVEQSTGTVRDLSVTVVPDWTQYLANLESGFLYKTCTRGRRLLELKVAIPRIAVGLESCHASNTIQQRDQHLHLKDSTDAALSTQERQRYGLEALYS